MRRWKIRRSQGSDLSRRGGKNCFGNCSQADDDDDEVGRLEVDVAGGNDADADGNTM